MADGLLHIVLQCMDGATQVKQAEQCDSGWFQCLLSHNGSILAPLGGIDVISVVGFLFLEKESF